LFTNIALSLTDSTQSDKLVIYFLSFLHLMPNLDKERYGSPFEGVILKILRSRWDTNCLNPGVWAQGHSQRMRMLTAGEALNPGESTLLIQLATEVMTHHADLSAQDHLKSGRGDSFIRTGSAWLRDLVVNNMRNWSDISTDTRRNALAFSFDDTINYGNCIHVLCLLCSEGKTNRIIREDNGIDEISDYLPTQFPIERKKIDLSHTFTLHNTNLRFTLRTLRYLTEPEDDYPHITRTNRSSNLKKVFDTLQAWMSDETSRGLTLQVLHNLIRGIETTRVQQYSPTDPDKNSTWERQRRTLLHPEPRTYFTDWKSSRTRSNNSRVSYRTIPPNIT